MTKRPVSTMSTKANHLVAVIGLLGGRACECRSADRIGTIVFVKLRPMLQVAEVAASSDWYQRALGLRSGHGGDDFEMLFDGQEFVLQLHRLDAHEHGIVRSDSDGPRGAGLSLWFEAPDRSEFDSLFERACGAGAKVAEAPHWNPLAHHHEATLIDPDGYVVVIHSPFEFDGD